MQHDQSTTLRVRVAGGANEIEGRVDRGADLEGVFFITTDDGERIKVFGWQCAVDIVEG